MDLPEQAHPTPVEKYFFRPLYYPRTVWDVVRWWESRRLVYNAVIGGVGVATLTAVSLLAPSGATPSGWLVPWVPVLLYGVMANVCYSLGAPVDLLLRRWLGDRAAPAGPALFRYGFVFSLGLTLLPIPLVTIGWVLRWLLL